MELKLEIEREDVDGNNQIYIIMYTRTRLNGFCNRHDNRL